MEVNKIYNINFLDNTLPDKCANLIIADPPYFEVKGDFDFIWKSFNDYLQDVEKWAIECKRLLADNGTLFWWGDKKKIAYSQIILDKYFNLENSIVWRKIDSMQYQYYSPDLARTFNTHNERLLMYSNEVEQTGFEMIHSGTVFFYDIKKYLDDELKKSGYTQTTIKEVLGNQMASHYFGFSEREKTQFALPTKEHYTKLQTTGYFKKEYESLRQEYESLRRYFYNPNKYEEVMGFSQEGHKTKLYDHETKKPEGLTSALIVTCSRPNDLVVVPFAGSGTECAMAVKYDRKTIGFEITEKHAKMSNDRVQNILRQPSLFVGS